MVEHPLPDGEAESRETDVQAGTLRGGISPGEIFMFLLFIMLAAAIMVGILWLLGPRVDTVYTNIMIDL